MSDPNGPPGPVDPSSERSSSLARDPGTVVGAYRLLELIGEGGMGRVYLAEHVRLGRKVALKMLRSEYATNATAVKRFFAEARAVNRISHEHIVEITDFVEKQGEDNYIIMELLRGADLHDLRAREGFFPLPFTLSVAAQVCDALAAVHGAGMIHRDLKPDNIFITERAGRKDWVKLLDFGVAKLMDRQPGESFQLERTGAGAIIGTPEYMSPEQISGKEVDARTDIYAIGVILYELVTGRKPFEAKNFGEMVIKHVTVAPTRPSRLKNLPAQVPLALEALIMACLEKEPEKRPQTMKEIEERLRAVPGFPPDRARSDVTGVVTLPPLSLPAEPRPRWRRPAILAGAGALVVAAVVAVLLSWRGGGAEPAKTVRVAFESTPPGAHVYVDGAASPIGVTPFATTFQRGERVTSFGFRLGGHRGALREIAMTEDARLVVALAALPAAAPTLAPLPLTVAAAPPPPTEPRARAAAKPHRKEPAAPRVKPTKPARKGSDEDLGGTIDAFE